MGLWDRLLALTNPTSYEPAQIVQPDAYEPYMATGGLMVADPATPIEEFIATGHASRVHRFWRTQPNLRKVIDFIARNVSSLPLAAYERVSDTERVRLDGEPLADLLRSPQPGRAPIRFWGGVLADGLLYDRWAVLDVAEDDGRRTLRRLPARRLWMKTDSFDQVSNVYWWDGAKWVDIPLHMLIFDHGYSPSGAGLSPVETLRGTLEESSEAERYRRDLWENGTRAPGYIHRPHDAGAWKEGARNRFVESLRAQFGRGGTRPGGLPLLEDGMEIRRLDIFSPRDMKDIEARQLTAVEVASAFHIAPELVGAREGTYSNLDAFRQMLWSSSLGPYIDAWVGTLNAQLVPRVADGRNIYIEANVETKLRGSFLEQATVMQSATGAPWMTRNEARAMQNRPAIEGGDDLVVPLNVLTGGLASPNDADPTKPRAGSAGTPSAAESEAAAKSDTIARTLQQVYLAVDKVITSDEARAIVNSVGADLPIPGPDFASTAKGASTLAKFLARQERVVRGAAGSGDAAWKGDRWDVELTEDLTPLLGTAAGTIARRINAETRSLVEAGSLDAAFTQERAESLAALLDHHNQEDQ